MDWTQQLLAVAGFLLGLITLGLALFASGHALLYRRDSRSAALWVGFIWLAPLTGALLYYLFGINRLRRHAARLRGEADDFHPPPPSAPCPAEAVADHLPGAQSHLRALAVTVDRVSARPLLSGNRVEPLFNGDAAYPAMLAAIGGARESVSLASYIFDHDEAGLAFAEALGAAVKRGVEVRVLVDATGARYSWPSILRVLRAQNVRHARFHPTSPLWQLLSTNLRCHRKIMVVDGRIGFTGGINIRAGHWLGKNPPHPVRDLHFRLTGPVVAELQATFADDWLFVTHETLQGERWFPDLASAGPVLARGIPDGPDEDFERLRWTILAALTAARRSVRIATPYFLPDPTIIAALNLAVLRGVQVDILLPARNNLPFVQWASTALWWQVLQRGCRIWLSPPPFDHTKIILVDGGWTLLGSANLDPRSLRLNFEFNVECYDPALHDTLAAWFDDMAARSRQTSLAEVDARSLPVKLRDGIARLWTPFL